MDISDNDRFDSRAELTVFYDGYCPLCVSEMRQLRKLDDGSGKAPRLQLEDIQHCDFAERYPDIDAGAADRILHGRFADGRMIYGLDVTVAAWSLVGRKRWLRVLRLPVLRWFADRAYLLFARHRYTLSYWLIGQRRCATCTLDKNGDGYSRASH